MNKLEVRYHKDLEHYYIYLDDEMASGLGFGFKSRGEAEHAARVIKDLAEASKIFK